MRTLLIAILAALVAFTGGTACYKGGGGNQPGASGVPGY